VDHFSIAEIDLNFETRKCAAPYSLIVDWKQLGPRILRETVNVWCSFDLPNLIASIIKAVNVTIVLSKWIKQSQMSVACSENLFDWRTQVHEFVADLKASLRLAP
jgi:hypothetical protein